MAEKKMRVSKSQPSLPNVPPPEMGDLKILVSVKFATPTEPTLPPVRELVLTSLRQISREPKSEDSYDRI
jgi:hypothetical protein